MGGSGGGCQTRHHTTSVVGGSAECWHMRQFHGSKHQSGERLFTLLSLWFSGNWMGHSAQTQYKPTIIAVLHHPIGFSRRFSIQIL